MIDILFRLICLNEYKEKDRYDFRQNGTCRNSRNDSGECANSIF